MERIPYNAPGHNITQTVESWLLDAERKIYRLKYTVGEIEELRRNPEDFWKLYRRLVEMLDLSKCKNVSIISEVFQFALFFENDIFAPRNVNPAGCADVTEKNFVARLMTRPYKCSDSHSSNQMIQIVDTFGTSYFRYDLMQWALLNGTYMFVIDKLKYGVMYFALNDHERIWDSTYSKMRGICKLLKSEHLLLDKSKVIPNFMSLSAESRQRMLAVVRAVDIIMFAKHLKEKKKTYLLFRLAFETIPEPFITSQEIKKFLQLCLSGQMVHSIMEEMCNTYEKVFPESVQPRTPRSLLHLSRCQVGQNLREAGHLPHGVAHLGIPVFLQKYVVHTGSESMLDEFKKWNFPAKL